MDVVPLPEIFAALVVSVVAIAIRFAWRAGRARFVRHADTARRPAIGEHEPERIRARLVASCVLLVIISVPLILRLVPPNGMYGFRVGGSMSTPEIWYQANAFSGWADSIAAMVSATLLMVLPATAKRWMLWVIFLAPLAVAVVLSFAYLRTL